MKKRIIAFIMVLCMTVAILPLKEPVHFFKNIITVDAYDRINEYPDFSLDIYVADLMTDPVRDSPSYRHLNSYINRDESPNSIIYKSLNQDADFRSSVAAWETVTFKPSNITETTLDQVEYYEAIILKALKCKTNDVYLEECVKGGEKLAKDGYETFISILESEYFATYDFDNIDWKSLPDVQKDDLLQAFEKSFEKEFPLVNTTKDVMTAFSEILNVCTNLKEAYDRIVSYQMCYELSEHMKHVVNDLYNNCSTDNIYMKMALDNINQACKEYNFFTAFDAAGDSLGNLSIEYMMKFSDIMWDTVITLLPGGKSVLICQIVGQNIANWLFSTDETIEQYHKMEALMNFETLVRSVTNYEMQQFRANKTEENAKILFSSIELFFNTYDLSCDFANDMAKIVYTKGIVNVFLDNSDKYNEITNSIRNIRRYAAEAYDNLIKFYWLADLEYEHPDIYETMVKQNEYEEYMKTFVAVTGVKFPMHEIEIGLEDLGAGLCGAYVTPSDATIKEIIYTSSDSSVAEMINDSLVIYKVGTATITAKSADGGFTDKMTVNVVEGHGNDGTQPTQIGTAKVGDTFATGGLTYKVTSDDEVELTGHTSEPVGGLYIPDVVSYRGNLFNVTSIGYRAFKGCSDLTSIIIPDSVKLVDYDAFNNCSRLQNVTIGSSDIEFDHDGGAISLNHGVFTGSPVKRLIFSDGITTINANMTYSMQSTLEEVVIPDSVTYIEAGTFSGCSKLTHIDLPDNLTTINDYTFYNCSGLTSINIPNSVTSVGHNAFGDCTELQCVTIGSNVIDFADNVFYDCNSIKKLIFADGLESINSNMTRWITSSLEEVVIPNSVTYIGESTFADCSGLTNINIPDSVTSIDRFAFSACSGLTNINIPDSVTSIGESAFSGCSGLTSINIPDSVTSIGLGAFSGCSGLTNLNIPDSVTNIGKSAFSNCSGLTSIVIPDSVITIGESAFSYCKSLANITIGNSVTSIERNAFRYCDNLTIVNIPYSVRTIVDGAFCDCSQLEKIIIDNPNCTIYGISGHYGAGGDSCTICNDNGTYYNVICGYSNSSAQIYAENHNFKFEVIDKTSGDVNMDGSFNIADVVMMQKWLLAVPDVKFANWQAADLCEDGRLDVFDLCLMKRLLLNS